MVIQKFNKLIRNKWIWGVFAIAISAFFAFDFLVADLNDRGSEPTSGNAGTLAGKAIDAKRYQAIADDVRGLGRNRDWHQKAGEVNRTAWENYAALTVAEKDGIVATAQQVQETIRRDPSFQDKGQFNFALYQRLLAANSITPEGFEASLRRGLTLDLLGRTVLGSAAWASPMELDQAVADMTDVFTIKVARFTQDAKDMLAVKMDDAGLKKWYEAHVKELALPELVKIRYLKFDATATNILAKMTVTEDEIRDQFDVTADKYVVKGTNGTETVKKFDQLTKAEKDGIEKDLRRIAAVQFFETNLNFRVYGKKAAKGASRIDEIAKEDGLKVETSDWFASDSSYHEGFCSRMSMILPGSKGFSEAVAELDPSSEDLRYAVVSSDRAVWLIEKTEVKAKHTPTFAEAKKAIHDRALRDARADAFKASVEAIAKKGAKAVLAGKSVSTNLTFSISDLRSGNLPDQSAIVRAAMKLKAGEVSEFTLGGMPGHALLVVCEKRDAGDAAKAMLLKSQMREEIAMLARRQLPEAWKKWNLSRLGFEPGELSSVEIVDEDVD